MLRIIFVLLLLGVGVGYAVQGALYSLLLYLWLAYFRPEQWVWYDFVSNLNLSFIAGIWTLFMVAFAREKFRFNLRIALLALFLLHAFISTMVAPHRDYAWPWWVEFSKGILMTYLLIMLVTDAAKFRLVLLVIAVSLGFEAAKQGWGSLLTHPGGLNNNELPMLGDNNGVAVGMLMLVPILTTLAGTATSKRERALHRFLAIGVVNRAISTYSRGGFLAAGALAMAYALRSPRRVPAIIGILLTAAIIIPVLPDAFWDRMKTIKPPDPIAAARGTMTGDDESSLGRLHFWNVALRMADDRPLVGVGYNSYNANYDNYDDTKGAFGYSRSVHSAWFGVLAELGYPGLFLFVAQIILAFRACARARKAAKLGSEYADLGKFAFALEASLVAFIVGGTFLPFQHTEMLWHVLGLTIALDILARTALASSTVDVWSRSVAPAYVPVSAAALVS